MPLPKNLAQNLAQIQPTILQTNPAGNPAAPSSSWVVPAVLLGGGVLAVWLYMRSRRA